jgi:sugar phosphate isomerase/epimerase
VNDRRQFLRSALALAAAGGSTTSLGGMLAHAAAAERTNAKKMRFGLVTYMWGADWDLPTLLRNCEKAGAAGVELRTQHAHKVEPNLKLHERIEVKKRFADGPVTLVGLGTNEAFHSADSNELKANIERAKEFITLGHDIGGSGVKVKPNDLPKGVPQKKTTEQIGRALNELAAFGADYGQQVRLEVHGQCAPLPIIAEIMEVADHPNVGVCWNSNRQDVEGEGLEHNFTLVAKRFGATLHAHDLEKDKYPYADLFRLLKEVKYDGWVLIEASDKPVDRVKALAEQRMAFEKLCA